MSAKQNKIRQQAWTDKKVANAEYFQACLFLGKGIYDKRESPTLEGARELRKQMQEEWKLTNFGRPVLIYAITKGDHLTIHVE